MAKDDISLGVEMGKLEIEPIKVEKTVKEENPFVYIAQTTKRRPFSKALLPTNCSCGSQKRNMNLGISKKKHNQILKEPILKFLKNLQHQHHYTTEEYQSSSKKDTLTENFNLDSLGALVDNCNQLRISSELKRPKCLMNESSHNDKTWWKSNPTIKQSKDLLAGKSQAGSCSQQALNPPCDVTIDELASYFETLVHIPKKMSSMAEMMYI